MASTKRLLLLGGHGKVSLHMTPLLLANSWRVTSVIRDESQKDEVLSAAKEHPELIDVLVSSLEDVKTQADAKKIIDQSRASCVVWSAGKPKPTSYESTTGCKGPELDGSRRPACWMGSIRGRGMG